MYCQCLSVKMEALKDDKNRHLVFWDLDYLKINSLGDPVLPQFNTENESPVVVVTIRLNSTIWNVTTIQFICKDEEVVQVFTFCCFFFVGGVGGRGLWLIGTDEQSPSINHEGNLTRVVFVAIIMRSLYFVTLEKIIKKTFIFVFNISMSTSVTFCIRQCIQTRTQTHTYTHTQTATRHNTPPQKGTPVCLCDG